MPTRGARNFYNLYNPSLQSVELLHSTAFVSEPREQQQRGGLGFLPETASVRESEWTVAPIPADLTDRRVEIRGPADPMEPSVSVLDRPDFDVPELDLTGARAVLQPDHAGGVF
jgi:hypothetical protein